MKNSKGFTLIEMLVVIAIIGILSAVVLTALGPSRNKAKDTRIISDLQQVRAIMETLYNGSSGTYPDGSVALANSQIATAANDIKVNNGSSQLFIKPDTGSTSFWSYALLNDSNYYCVDSAGNSLELGTTAPTGPACK